MCNVCVICGASIFERSIPLCFILLSCVVVAFRMYDLNGDGFITKDEMQKVQLVLPLCGFSTEF